MDVVRHLGRVLGRQLLGRTKSGLGRLEDRYSPPLAIHIDNAEVLRAAERGKKWCSSLKARVAAMWKEVWKYMDEMGGGLRLWKVKAHTSCLDVLTRRIAHVHHIGNGRADEAAKAAARAAEREAPTASFNLQVKRAFAWFCAGGARPRRRWRRPDGDS